MISTIKKHSLFFKNKSASNCISEKDDYLVDYDDEPIAHKKQSIAERCRQRIVRKPADVNRCTLSYTEKGYIKRPDPSSPVTMDMIQSVILQQHCHISKPEELVWFQDGLKWLSQQQYLNKNNSYCGYYIEEEKNYTGWDQKLQHDVEDLERACEAYFGIPLGLCQDHWAAEYLMNQASKGRLLRRVALLQPSPSFRKSLRRFFCFL